MATNPADNGPLQHTQSSSLNPSGDDHDLLPVLAIGDVEAIIRLLGEACDPTTEIPAQERRRALVSGLAELVEADAWFAGIGCSADDDPANAMAVRFVDGGWRSEQERAEVFGVTSNSELASMVNSKTARSRSEERTVTITRLDVAADEEWFASECGRAWADAGFDHFIISVYPLETPLHAGLGIYRRLGRPPFTSRDRTLVHVVWQQVEWLHRLDGTSPVGNDCVVLSPRERQVTMLILGGDSTKQIAAKLGLSEYTVGDYIKAVYRKLLVKSRAELFAKFTPLGG